MNFLYCFDEHIKKELEQHGYRFIKEVSLKNSRAFLFFNNIDSSTFKFEKQNIVFTDRMNF